MSTYLSLHGFGGKGGNLTIQVRFDKRTVLDASFFKPVTSTQQTGFVTDAADYEEWRLVAWWN